MLGGSSPYVDIVLVNRRGRLSSSPSLGDRHVPALILLLNDEGGSGDGLRQNGLRGHGRRAGGFLVALRVGDIDFTLIASGRAADELGLSATDSTARNGGVHERRRLSTLTRTSGVTDGGGTREGLNRYGITLDGGLELALGRTLNLDVHIGVASYDLDVSGGGKGGNLQDTVRSDVILHFLILAGGAEIDILEVEGSSLGLRSGRSLGQGPSGAYRELLLANSGGTGLIVVIGEGSFLSAHALILLAVIEEDEAAIASILLTGSGLLTLDGGVTESFQGDAANESVGHQDVLIQKHGLESTEGSRNLSSIDGTELGALVEAEDRLLLSVHHGGDEGLSLSGGTLLVHTLNGHEGGNIGAYGILVVGVNGSYQLGPLALIDDVLAGAQLEHVSAGVNEVQSGGVYDGHVRRSGAAVAGPFQGVYAPTDDSVILTVVYGYDRGGVDINVSHLDAVKLILLAGYEVISVGSVGAEGGLNQLRIGRDAREAVLYGLNIVADISLASGGFS